jgi:hypothetical protein
VSYLKNTSKHSGKTVVTVFHCDSLMSDHRKTPAITVFTVFHCDSLMSDHRKTPEISFYSVPLWFTDIISQKNTRNHCFYSVPLWFTDVRSQKNTSNHSVPLWFTDFRSQCFLAKVPCRPSVKLFINRQKKCYFHLDLEMTICYLHYKIRMYQYQGLTYNFYITLP